MKISITAAIIMLTLSGLVNAHERTLIISSLNSETSIGFSDSSFSHDAKKTFCFYGNLNQVCSEIAKSARNINYNYASGNHDTIDVKSCKTDFDEEYAARYEDYSINWVTVKYLLSDDYGSKIDVVKKIERCNSSL